MATIKKITLEEYIAKKLKKQLTEGFMGLDHVVDSDTASDSFEDIKDAMAKAASEKLLKLIPKQGDKFNTSGAVNVALMFKDFFNDNIPYRNSLKRIAEKCHKELEKQKNEIAAADKDFPDKDKKWLLKKYNILLDELDNYE